MAVWYSLWSFCIFFPFWYFWTKKNLATLFSSAGEKKTSWKIENEQQLEIAKIPQSKVEIKILQKNSWRDIHQHQDQQLKKNRTD
jgi:hypothetical protein